MNTGGTRGNRNRPLKMRTFPGHKGKWYKIPLIESLAEDCWKVYKKVITSADRARQKEETRKELERD